MSVTYVRNPETGAFEKVGPGGPKFSFNTFMKLSLLTLPLVIFLAINIHIN